jgi:hypothetical protein
LSINFFTDLAGLIGSSASPGAAEVANKPSTPQPDFAALGLLGEGEDDDMEVAGDDKKDEANKESAPATLDIQISPGIVSPYRTRHLTKHVDMLWRRTAGETYDFRPVKVFFMTRLNFQVLLECGGMQRGSVPPSCS